MSEITDIRELICIGCPMGCRMTVTIKDKDRTEKGEASISVTGNTCKRGAQYAVREVTNPTRIVTSTARTEGGERPVTPVKTQRDIPKDKIGDCMREIKALRLTAPVRIGDVVIENTAGTGVAVIATKNCAKKETMVR